MFDESEQILHDDFPVYPTYWYLVDGEPKQSDIEGTVRDLKRVEKANEIRRCEAVKRELIIW